MRESNRVAARLSVALLFIGGVMAASPACAQEVTWLPPEPSLKSKDWIKLNSGEWLRGNIDLMRDDKLFFDSDELDDLEIDWGDIAEIRSLRIFTFFRGGVATGTCSMRDGIIKVDTGTAVREFERTDLSSVLEGNPRELNFWSLKSTLGIIARAGNSEQADMAAYLRLRREATRSRFNFDYTGNIGSVQKEQNINNHLISTDFNIFISRLLFVTPVGAEMFTDKFQNIDYRATIGAAFGYYLWRRGKFKWFLSLGGAYQSIQYVSVQPEEDRKSDNGSIIPTLNIDWDITGDIELDVDYGAQIGVPDAKRAFHNLFVVLSVELSSYLDWDTSLQWNHNENPVADAEGNIPERDDLLLSVGLGLDL